MPLSTRTFLIYRDIAARGVAREAKAAALGAGALGCSISGSGPTSFAFADSDPQAARVAQAMADAYRKAGVACSTRVERISVEGARVLHGTEPGT